MKILLTTVLLWGGMFMSQLEAQNTTKLFGDSLNIFERNETYARVIFKDIHKLTKTTELEDLLTSFFHHLELVKANIPEYLNYQINYDEGNSLTVEEVIGITKYKIGADQQLSEFKQSVAHLKKGDLHVFLYFNKLEDLVTQKFALTISNALDKIKEIKPIKRAFSKNSFRTYNYSYSENRLLKDKEHYSSKRRFTIVSSGSIGLYKDQAIYEVSSGFGFFIGAKRNNLLYLSDVFFFQYDEERDKTIPSKAIELGFLFVQQAAIKFAIPYREGKVFNDIDYRLSVNVYPKKNLSVGLQIYHGFRPKKVFPGITVGFGI